jgi:hypothetical protein
MLIHDCQIANKGCPTEQKLDLTKYNRWGRIRMLSVLTSGTWTGYTSYDEAG